MSTKSWRRLFKHLCLHLQLYDSSEPCCSLFRLEKFSVQICQSFFMSVNLLIGTWTCCGASLWFEFLREVKRRINVSVGWNLKFFNVYLDPYSSCMFTICPARGIPPLPLFLRFFCNWLDKIIPVWTKLPGSRFDYILIKQREWEPERIWRTV